MFPGAAAELDDPDYAILGAPLDNTTTFYPGTRFGPDRIRRFARHFDDYDHETGLTFTDLSVADHGNIPAGDDTAEYLEYLRSTIVGYALDDVIPVVLGGEHTVTVAGVRATEPRAFVTFDAHLDLRDAYDGNPLNHATATRRALETADEAVIIGARTGSEEEWDRADHDDVTVVPAAEAARWSAELEGPIYLSVDIDGIDPAAAPGTGTPEPFGLDPRVVHRLVADLAPSCVGFDVVEVNDRDHGQAATLAGKLVRRFVYNHAAASR